MSPREEKQQQLTEAYGDYYGESWPDLLKSLNAPGSMIARANGFLPNWPVGLEQELAWYKGAFSSFPEGEPAEINGLLGWYLMDAASLVPAMMLDIRPQMKVLDLCAAPGGKSLILAERLAGTGELHLNELSADRRRRLKRVCQQYLGESDSVRIFGHDGAKWGMHHPESYDRVLLDAPCSGERHGLSRQDWSPKASKKLAIRQYGLLCSALMALKSGGRLVYSTCSISPQENDGVVGKLLGKGKPARVIKPEPPIGDFTEHGIFIRPDRHGFGPIYLSIIEKT